MISSRTLESQSKLEDDMFQHVAKSENHRASTESRIQVPERPGSSLVKERGGSKVSRNNQDFEEQMSLEK